MTNHEILIALIIAGHVATMFKGNIIWEYVDDWTFYKKVIRKSIILRFLFFELIALTIALPCFAATFLGYILAAILTTIDWKIED